MSENCPLPQSSHPHHGKCNRIGYCSQTSSRCGKQSATYLYTIWGNDQTMTPTHFLHPPHLHPSNVVEVNPNTIDSSKQSLVLQYHWTKGIVENYVQAFRKHYCTVLCDLQVLHHHHPRGSHPHWPNVGDVVLIYKPKTNCTQWQVGTIIKVLQ